MITVQLDGLDRLDDFFDDIAAHLTDMSEWFNRGTQQAGSRL